MHVRGPELRCHAWHLADLEREGYGERLVRLRAGGGPFLPEGDQEGVGVIALRDVPHMMAEHDVAHRLEIERCWPNSPADSDGPATSAGDPTAWPIRPRRSTRCGILG